MKHRRVDIFGHQTSLALEPEYWGWIGELRAKTGASLRDVLEAVVLTSHLADRYLLRSALPSPSTSIVVIRRSITAPATSFRRVTAACI